jgi:hypothetical protein
MFFSPQDLFVLSMGFQTRFFSSLPADLQVKGRGPSLRSGGMPTATHYPLSTTHFLHHHHHNHRHLPVG